MSLLGIGSWHQALKHLPPSSLLAYVMICLLSFSFISFSGCLTHEPEPLYGELITITAEKISTALDETEESFLAQCRENRSFLLSSLHPSSSNLSAGEIIPQLMASRLLAELVHSNASLLLCHQQNLDYILSQWYVENATHGYFLYQNTSTLGMNALILQAILWSPFNESSYRDKAKGLASTLLFLQNDNGSFEQSYPDGKTMSSQTLSEEGNAAWAILGLEKYATETGNITYRAAAFRAQHYYLQLFNKTGTMLSLAPTIPWYTLSLSALYRSTGNLSYAEAVVSLNDYLLSFQDRVNSDTLGKFTINQRSVCANSSLYCTALCTRSLLSAYQIVTLLNDTTHQTSFRIAALAGLHHLLHIVEQSNEQRTSTLQENSTINATRLLEIIVMIETFKDALTSFNETGSPDWEFYYYPELDLVIERTPPHTDDDNTSKWYALTLGVILGVIFLFAIYGVIRLRRR
jgi:hypothetical protein